MVRNALDLLGVFLRRHIVDAADAHTDHGRCSVGVVVVIQEKDLAHRLPIDPDALELFRVEGMNIQVKKLNRGIDFG